MIISSSTLIQHNCSNNYNRVKNEHIYRSIPEILFIWPLFRSKLKETKFLLISNVFMKKEDEVNILLGDKNKPAIKKWNEVISTFLKQQKIELGLIKVMKSSRIFFTILFRCHWWWYCWRYCWNSRPRKRSSASERTQKRM